MTPHVSASARPECCPLCGGAADARPGSMKRRRYLLRCAQCRAFVIDAQLADVIDNARVRHVKPVLERLPLLSRATQAAADSGSVMSLTSTNWIRVAMEQALVTTQIEG
jgi:hypothetical protein